MTETSDKRTYKDLGSEAMNTWNTMIESHVKFSGLMSLLVTEFQRLPNTAYQVAFKLSVMMKKMIL